MPLVPRAMRPSVVIRRKALYQGVFGSSRLWKLIAAVVFGRSTFKRIFGRNEEVLEVATLKGPGRVISVETYRNPTRRQRRKARAAARASSV